MATKKTNDNAFKNYTENKIEKSIRNTKEFKDALSRAQNGEYDKDIKDASDEDFLKVCERWTIRKMFSLEKGKDYYKLFKEVFYIENPHKKYYETVNPTIYRRLAPQHEEGDKDWADAVSQHEKIDIVE